MLDTSVVGSCRATFGMAPSADGVVNDRAGCDGRGVPTDSGTGVPVTESIVYKFRSIDPVHGTRANYEIKRLARTIAKARMITPAICKNT